MIIIDEEKNVSKVIYGGEVLIDLTSDTVDEAHLLRGYTAHDMSGAQVIGSCEFDVNSEDATVTSDEILAGQTAYARGSQLIGSMPNNGGINYDISTAEEEYTIPTGFHDGSGKVGISQTERDKLLPSNIRQGVNILGVEGTMSGVEDVTAEALTVTPSTSTQVVTPSEGYNYISQITVNAIPYSTSANSAGGITVTIG